MKGLRPQTSDTGFTLAELLVSLVVVSLIGGLLVNGLGAGARAFERVTIASQQARDIKLVHLVLKEQVSDIYPKFRDTKDGTLVDFQGSGDEVRYWSKLPRAFGEGGYVRTRVYFETAGAGRDLKISWCEDTSRAAAWQEFCTEKTLITSLARGEFLFYDRDKEATLVRWKDRGDLPALVQIEISFSEGDARTWPDFSVAPRRDKAADCRFDPVSKRCRR